MTIKLNHMTTRHFPLLTLLMAVLTIPTYANAYSCAGEFENEINQLGIQKERIQNFSTVNIYGTGESGGGNLQRVEGWVSFKDCKGNLIINLNAICKPQSNYTTNECSVAGIKNY